MNKIFSRHGLNIFDVEELSIHGGSLRIYATHEQQKLIPSKKIQKLIAKEKKLGLRDITTYTNFNEKVISLKLDLWKFFINVQNPDVVYHLAAYTNPLRNENNPELAKECNTYYQFLYEKSIK